jgi:ABC-2 type transport system permease protein
MLPLLFILPVIQLVVLSFAADFEVKNIKMAVLDLDKSQASRSLINSFTASGYFTISNYYESSREAMMSIETEEADFVLSIPKDMDQDLSNFLPVKTQLLFNAVDNQKAAIANTYAQQVVNNWNKKRWSHVLNAAAFKPVSVEIREQYWYNPRLDYKTFMVPGILAILVTMLTAFLSSINIIREREMGTIEQINVTPITKMEFILGKIIPFWIIGMVLMTVGLIVARLLFGISSVGNIAILYAFVAIYLVAILGLGILISTLTDTQQQAMFITWFFLVIFLLLSGLFTPVDSIPAWAKAFNLINPVKYFVEVMRMVMLKGSGFADVASRFWTIAGFAIIYNLLAIKTYSKTSS